MTVHVLVSLEVPSDDFEEALLIATNDISDRLNAVDMGYDWEIGSPEAYGYEIPAK